MRKREAGGGVVKDGRRIVFKKNTNDETRFARSSRSRFRVYQLRRSGVASHLLKTKLLIVNNKLTRKHVTFEVNKLKITKKKK